MKAATEVPAPPAISHEPAYERAERLGLRVVQTERTGPVDPAHVLAVLRRSWHRGAAMHRRDLEAYEELAESIAADPNGPTLSQLRFFGNEWWRSMRARKGRGEIDPPTPRQIVATIYQLRESLSGITVYF